MKMVALLVTIVFNLIFLTAVTSDGTNLKSSSYRKETSTTFLRLTALRSDEGIWTARFGEYEISIELKHHPKPLHHMESEDTWTLKIKHTSKRFKVPKSRDDSDNNNIPMSSESSSDTKETWQQLFDVADNDMDEDDMPKFKKIKQSGKSKRAKARRQLTDKQTEDSNKTNSTLTQRIRSNALHEPPIFKELAQGNNRLEVAFDRTQNETNKSENVDQLFNEFDDKPWNNVAAVIFHAHENQTFPGSFSQNNEPVENVLENNSTEEIESIMDAYALPLQQVQLTDENYKPVTVTPQDVNNSNAEEKINIDETLSSTMDSVITNDNEYNSLISTTTEEPRNLIPERSTTDIISDYLIEDPTVREYDKEGDEDDYDKEDSVEVGFQPSSEMKRIMDWFPRSKPLTSENNGYKLFPGVGWFKFVTWPDRWTSAREVCESDGAHLAVPDKREKVDVFLKIFKNYPDVLEKTILYNQVYIGIHSTGDERNFTTVLGKQYVPTFPIWFEDEPDNADPGEDCVTFHAEGKIRDVPCFYSLPFLCEKEGDLS